jgi:quercetin dioxygenase-like cupin family protein
MTADTADPTALRSARLTDLVEIAPGGIVSRPLLEYGPVKQVLFAMDAGQALSEHSASSPGTVHVLQGKLSMRVLGEDHVLQAHDWLMMPAHAPHRVVAEEPTLFLLSLFKDQEGNS